MISIDIPDTLNWSYEPDDLAKERVLNIENTSNRCAKDDTTPERLRELAYNNIVKTETQMSFVDLHELNMTFDNKFTISQLILLEECTDLDHARSCWIKKLEERQAESIGYINKEISNASAPELVDELNNILELTKSTVPEAKTALSEKTCLQDIITYWPAILLPAPGCVRYYERLGEDLSVIPDQPTVE